VTPVADEPQAKRMEAFKELQALLIKHGCYDDKIIQAIWSYGDAVYEQTIAGCFPDRIAR